MQSYVLTRLFHVKANTTGVVFTQKFHTTFAPKLEQAVTAVKAVSGEAEAVEAVLPSRQANSPVKAAKAAKVPSSSVGFRKATMTPGEAALKKERTEYKQSVRGTRSPKSASLPKTAGPAPVRPSAPPNLAARSPKPAAFKTEPLKSRQFGPGPNASVGKQTALQGPRASRGV